MAEGATGSELGLSRAAAGDRPVGQNDRDGDDPCRRSQGETLMTQDATGPDGFGSLLRSFRERAGLSQSALARRAGLDPSFVNRLESGQRSAERAVAEKLVEALALGPPDADALLAAGGYLPSSLSRLWLRDPTLRTIAQILTDDRLSEADRDDFRRVIALLAKRWLADR